MGVWDHLADFSTIASLLAHPAQSAMTATVDQLLTSVRAAEDRTHLREVQADMFGYLLDAESRFGEARRLVSRRQGDELEVTFWRRACVQLRTVGDAIAWKFLGYQRKMIMLMRRGGHAGLFLGKIGTEVEWALFNEHWEAGEPTLLTGLTMCLRHGDLLVDEGSGNLKIVEAKANLAHSKSAQNRRVRGLLDQVNREPRYLGVDGPSWVVETEVPLRTYWGEATAALDRAIGQGASTWVPAPGLAVLFLAPGSIAASTQEEADQMLERERAKAGPAFGEAEHRILLQGTNYPYRTGPVAPLSILPVSPRYAAQLITGDVLFQIELDPERLAAALRGQGMDARLVLPPRDGDLQANVEVLRFAHGPWTGVLHAAGVEPVGIELQDPDVWARGVASATLPDRDPKFGLYFCLKEDGVWA